MQIDMDSGSTIISPILNVGLRGDSKNIMNANLWIGT